MKKIIIIALPIIIAIQAIFIILLLNKNRDLQLDDEMYLLNSLIKKSYFTLNNEIKGGSYSDSLFYFEKSNKLKYFVKNANKISSDSLDLFLDFIDGYFPNKKYLNDYKANFYSYPTYIKDLKTKLIEYAVINELLSSRVYSFYPIDCATIGCFANNDTINLGKKYHADLYFSGRNSGAPFTAVLDNGDTLPNGGVFPYFEEVSKKRGWNVHNGVLYVYNWGQYTDVDFEIKYFVK